MARNVDGGVARFKGWRGSHRPILCSSATARGSATAYRGPAVVELEIGLWLQRDEEVERKVAVWRAGKGEYRAPVVQVALQRHDLAGKLPFLEVEARVPGRRPLPGQREPEIAHQRRLPLAAIGRGAGRGA